MRIDQFELLVAGKKMRLERRVKEADQDIYIAEGYCSGDMDFGGPHYKTMYALSDGPERITLGEFFTTPIIFPIVDKEERLDEAENRAKQFLADMRTECPK